MTHPLSTDSEGAFSKSCEKYEARLLPMRSLESAPPWMAATGGGAEPPRPRPTTEEGGASGAEELNCSLIIASYLGSQELGQKWAEGLGLMGPHQADIV